MRGVPYTLKSPPFGNGGVPANITNLLKRKRDNAPNTLSPSPLPTYPRLKRPPAPALVSGQLTGHITAPDTITVPHGISDPEREAWMRWRLVPLEHHIGVRAVVNRHSIHLTAKVGSLNKQVQIAVEKVVEEAGNLVDLQVDLGSGAKHAKEDYMSMIRPLIEQYGMRVRVGSAATLHIVGPNQPAHDAAALLWAACAQGKSAALVIQAPGQIQALPSEMLTDFEGDLKTMENEFNVEVQKYHTMMGVAGAGQSTVLQARRTLQEMLMFYLPDEFLLLSGLSRLSLTQLRTNGKLKALILRLGCTIALDDSEGTAWICGRSCVEMEKHIEAVLAGRNPLQPSEPGTVGVDLQQGKCEEKRPPATQQRTRVCDDSESSKNISPFLDKEAQQRLEEAVLFGGQQALRIILDPADDLLWPEGEVCNLTWEKLEHFWTDACRSPINK